MYLEARILATRVEPAGLPLAWDNGYLAKRKMRLNENKRERTKQDGDRETERQRDRETERQRQTDRQAHT